MAAPAPRWHTARMTIEEARLGLRILRQNEHDLVVVKPPGMASDLTRDPRRESLISRVRVAAGPDADPKLVNRLDRVTSGPMIVALSREVAAFHGENIREGVWEKYYVARVPMPPKAMTGPGSTLIGKHKAFIREDQDRARLVRSGGKPSFMEILALAGSPDRAGEAHVLIRLLTGRLHQIRVMMAGLGLPLVGDEFYGGAEGPMYLEHIALWYVDFETRDLMLAHDPEAPYREALAKNVTAALAPILRRPMLLT